MLKGIFILNKDAYDKIYGPEERREIEQLVDIYAPQQTADSVRGDLSILADAGIIFSGWGMAVMAVLDVTYPEPPEPGSPLYSLPNVVLTPHIAGSMGRECRRMGRIVVNELKRYLDGEPLQWTISREQAARLA